MLLSSSDNRKYLNKLEVVVNYAIFEGTVAYEPGQMVPLEWRNGSLRSLAPSPGV